MSRKACNLGRPARYLRSLASSALKASWRWVRVRFTVDLAGCGAAHFSLNFAPVIAEYCCAHFNQVALAAADEAGNFIGAGKMTRL